MLSAQPSEQVSRHQTSGTMGNSAKPRRSSPATFEVRPAPSARPVPIGIPTSISKETYIALLAALGIAAHLTLRYVVHTSERTQLAPLLLTLIGAVPILIVLVRKLWAREFGSDLLAAISIIAS